jgi:pSer/pThr/pTyr-binding forkhead associated (FHA) protein
VNGTAQRTPTVAGISCGRGHFNDPRARFCNVCGLSMAQSSVIVVEAPRPPLGVLVLAGGDVVRLDRDIIVGRTVTSDPRVLSGSAMGLTFDDRTGHLSRLHAEVRLVGWEVHLVDHASTNGTYVFDDARRTWHRLAPKHPMLLRPGATIAFGRHTAVFQTPLRPQ